jgi:hypothetical protein
MHNSFIHEQYVPIPVAARSRAWVFGRSAAEIVDSNPTGGMDVCCVEKTMRKASQNKQVELLGET